MFLSRTDQLFPESLKVTRKNGINFKGNTNLLKCKSIAIVGSRKLSEYGKKNALEFSEYLSKRGYTIISGLAKGIDSYAHFGAMKGKGNTIAVLPSGINQIYPKENKFLAEKIVQNDGLLISEYDDDKMIQLKNFSKRNEVIALLSNCILLIEAGERSGSTNTARYGFKHNIPVFCLSGRIDDINSKGTNLLLSQGAHIAFNPQMIIDYLEWSNN